MVALKTLDLPVCQKSVQVQGSLDVHLQSAYQGCSRTNHPFQPSKVMSRDARHIKGEKEEN